MYTHSSSTDIFHIPSTKNNGGKKSIWIHKDFLQIVQIDHVNELLGGPTARLPCPETSKAQFQTLNKRFSVWKWTLEVLRRGSHVDGPPRSQSAWIIWTYHRYIYSIMLCIALQQHADRAFARMVDYQRYMASHYYIHPHLIVVHGRTTFSLSYKSLLIRFSNTLKVLV